MRSGRGLTSKLELVTVMGVVGTRRVCCVAARRRENIGPVSVTLKNKRRTLRQRLGAWQGCEAAQGPVWCQSARTEAPSPDCCPRGQRANGHGADGEDE